MVKIFSNQSWSFRLNIWFRSHQLHSVDLLINTNLKKFICLFAPLPPPFPQKILPVPRNYLWGLNKKIWVKNAAKKSRENRLQLLTWITKIAFDSLLHDSPMFRQLKANWPVLMHGFSYIWDSSSLLWVQNFRTTSLHLIAQTGLPLIKVSG